MKKLEQLRKAAGLTQQELGRISGIPQCSISQLERGVSKNPRIDTASRLARALHCTVEDLIEKEDA